MLVTFWQRNTERATIRGAGAKSSTSHLFNFSFFARFHRNVRILISAMIT
jgi:hypothetical protein